jgi:hypothetical protein
LTLSDISEFIEAKNHFLANIVRMQQLKKEIWTDILPDFTMKNFKNIYNFNKFWSILKYLFCSLSNLAQDLMLVILVKNNLHVTLTLSDISEYIQAKNHFHADIASMPAHRKEIWIHISSDITMKQWNLFKVFNKFWSILKYLFCSFTNLAQNLLFVPIVTNNVHQNVTLNSYWRKTIFLQILFVCSKSKSTIENTYGQKSPKNFNIFISWTHFLINKIFLFAVLQTWPKIFCLFFLSQTICIKKGPYTTYPNSYWRKTLYLWILLLYRKFARKFDQTYHQTSQWNFQICIEFQILINF